jgi:type III restriction enzyme
MLQRVMPELMTMKNIMALNDEAHHCYRERPEKDEEGQLKGDERDEANKNNEAARLWISGLEIIKRNLGMTIQIWRKSITPSATYSTSPAPAPATTCSSPASSRHLSFLMI